MKKRNTLRPAADEIKQIIRCSEKEGCQLYKNKSKKKTPNFFCYMKLEKY